MNCEDAEKSGEQGVISSFATIGTGSDLANLYCEAVLKNDDGIVVDQLVSDVIDGLDVVKLICDGSLTNESRGFWQFCNDWPKVAERLPAGFFHHIIDVTAWLYMLGGDDRAASMVLDAVVAYGEKNLSEVEQALHYALTKHETICCVLELIKVGLEGDGNNFFLVIISLLQREELDNKTKGAIYCGLRFLRLDKLSESIKCQFVDILRLGLESKSNDVLYAIGGTLIHQYEKTRNVYLWMLIETALSSKITAIGVLEQFASLRRSEITAEVAWQLLGKLIANDLSDREVKAIDLILTRVWEKDSDRALGWVEKIVVENSGDVSCDSFPGTMQKLGKMSGMFVNKSVTRWFLSNDVRLFRFANALMKGRDKDTDFLIEVDVNAVSDHPAKPWFIGRKGIGWFYFYHKTCVSFLMSCMAVMREEVLQDFMPSFFNPICLHYSKDVSDCLASRKGDADKPYYKMALHTLKQAEAIFAKAKTILPMPDFEPSIRQRAAFVRYQEKQMASIVKHAREEHPLLKLFTENPIVLLHGTKLVEWRKDREGRYHRSEHALTRNQVRFELPRLQQLDGLTLDYTLRRMQIERLVYEADS